MDTPTYTVHCFWSNNEEIILKQLYCSNSKASKTIAKERRMLLSYTNHHTQISFSQPQEITLRDFLMQGKDHHTS